MREHQLENAIGPLTRLRPSEHSRLNEAAFQGQFDPLAGLVTPAADARSVRTHAWSLNRATDSRPSRAERCLLQLQRRYGNHYVQRVLALARQEQGEGEVAPQVESAIERARGGGQPLDAGVRLQMESAFGADFGGVRVHTDSGGDSLNQAVGAVAFTTGNDIFFRQGTYSPGSSAGRELLAHELTHVVQQGGAPASGGQAQRVVLQRLCAACEEEKNQRVQGKLIVGQPNDQYEQEADRVAMAVGYGLEQRAVQRGQSWGTALPAALQRTCSCATSSGSHGECGECRKKRLGLQGDYEWRGGSTGDNSELSAAGEQGEVSLAQRQLADGGGGNGLDGGDSLGLGGLDCGPFNGCALMQDPNTGLNTCTNLGGCSGKCQLQSGLAMCCCRTQTSF